MTTARRSHRRQEIVTEPLIGCSGNEAPHEGQNRTARVRGDDSTISGELRYFHDVIEPQLSTDIEFVGEVGLAGKIELLGNAAALINPIRWPEPFGLVMIEALASGTPVITNRIGAAPEIVDDGITGTIADSYDDLVAGLEQIETFERSACRAAVEHRFTHLRMAKDHESFYRSVLQDSTTPANHPIESSASGSQR